MTEQWGYLDENHTVEPEDLESIRARLDEITAWPWYRSENDAVVSWSAQPVDAGPVMVVGRGVLPDGQSGVVVVPDGVDAQFIADAPSMVDKLVDAVDHWYSRFLHLRDRLGDSRPTEENP